MALKLEGDVQAGATSTLIVTDSSGSPIPNATVRYKLERLVGTTDADGQILVDIPADATEVELEARLDDQRGELEIEFKAEEEEDEGTEQEGAEVELSLEFESDPQPGEASILVVTDSEGNFVEGATVIVDGEPAGVTDDQGRLSITVPEDAEELEIKATLDDAEGELEIEF